MMDKGPSYCFFVEWYDQYAHTVRKFLLLYNEKTKSVEMHDQKFNRVFLKPTKIDDLKLSNLYPGSSVTILSRTLRIVDFADNFTRNTLGANVEKYVVFVRAGSICRSGKTLEALENEGFKLVNLKMVCLNSDEVRKISEENMNVSKIPHLLTEVSEKLILALELMGKGVRNRIIEMIGSGPLDAERGFVMNSDLLAIAASSESAACQSEQIFGYPGGPHFMGLPRLRGTTCAVIKPHAVTDGLTGKILDAIQSKGFCITAARLFRLSKHDAAEFLEVYKGVAHEYPEMLEHLASGPCVALEIASIREGEDVQQTFREFVGPIDPEVARFLRPDTLRARFGVDKVCNAIHCTDLPDDTELEVNFFFRILDK